jgi:hypothetical protein
MFRQIRSPFAPARIPRAGLRRRLPARSALEGFSVAVQAAAPSSRLASFDDQAVGSAGIAEEEPVPEVDDLPDRSQSSSPQNGRAREPADEEARATSLGDGRGHGPMRALRRGVGSRRSATAVWAARPRAPVRHRRRLIRGRDPIPGRARTTTAREAESPTPGQSTSRLFAHVPVRPAPQAQEARSR